jgi:short-subunit dehydrogenase
MAGTDLAGRVFVVTGAGDGIGRAVAEALVARGARVAGVDLREDALRETAANVGKAGVLSVHPCDVTSREQVERLPGAVLVEHARVDGLVNVAGIIHRFVRVADLSHEEIDRVLAVNFGGVVHMTKAFLPHLLESRRATLVNVGSMGALAPFPGQAAYGASKAAVTLFTQALRSELAGTSVTVTVAHPGAVATAIADNSGAHLPGMDGTAAGRLTTATAAAEQIIRGIETGAPRVLIGRDARLVDRLSRLAPTRTAALLARRMQALLP